MERSEIEGSSFTKREHGLVNPYTTVVSDEPHYNKLHNSKFSEHKKINRVINCFHVMYFPNGFIIIKISL